MAISRQNGLAMAAEVFSVLPLEGVAGRAESQGEYLLTPTRTEDRTLNSLCLHCLHDQSMSRSDSFSFNHPTVDLDNVRIITAIDSANHSHQFHALSLTLVRFVFPPFVATVGFIGIGLTIRSMVDLDTLNMVPSSCFEY